MSKKNLIYLEVNLNQYQVIVGISNNRCIFCANVYFIAIHNVILFLSFLGGFHWRNLFKYFYDIYDIFVSENFSC